MSNPLQIPASTDLTKHSSAGMTRPARACAVAGLIIAAMLAVLLPHRGNGFASAAEKAKTGLQFRLVAQPDDKSETDEMPDSSNGKGLRVLKTVALDGRDISRVYESKTQNGTAVGIDFSPDGAKKLEKITADNINHRLAIILDGKVLSAPRIMTRISKSVVITGGNAEFSPEQVKALVDSINASLKDAKPAKAD